MPNGLHYPTQAWMPSAPVAASGYTSTPAPLQPYLSSPARAPADIDKARRVSFGGVKSQTSETPKSTMPSSLPRDPPAGPKPLLRRSAAASSLVVPDGRHDASSSTPSRNLDFIFKNQMSVEGDEATPPNVTVRPKKTPPPPSTPAPISALHSALTVSPAPLHTVSASAPTKLEVRQQQQNRMFQSQSATNLHAPTTVTDVLSTQSRSPLPSVLGRDRSPLVKFGPVTVVPVNENAMHDDEENALEIAVESKFEDPLQANLSSGAGEGVGSEEEPPEITESGEMVGGEEEGEREAVDESQAGSFLPQIGQRASKIPLPPKLRKKGNKAAVKETTAVEATQSTGPTTRSKSAAAGVKSTGNGKGNGKHR